MPIPCKPASGEDYFIQGNMFHKLKSPHKCISFEGIILFIPSQTLGQTETEGSEMK